MPNRPENPIKPRESKDPRSQVSEALKAAGFRSQGTESSGMSRRGEFKEIIKYTTPDGLTVKVTVEYQDPQIANLADEEDAEKGGQ